jgi:hypothetical protein
MEPLRTGIAAGLSLLMPMPTSAGMRARKFSASTRPKHSGHKNPSGATISLNRWGQANGANLFSFYISPQKTGITSPAAKGICLAAGGRIRIIDQKDIPCV